MPVPKTSICPWCEKEFPQRHHQTVTFCSRKHYTLAGNKEWKSQIEARKAGTLKNKTAADYWQIVQNDPDKPDRTAYFKAYSKKHHKVWKKANPDKQRAATERRRLRQRAFLNNLKDKPCLDCGAKFPPECMDFDHVRGEKLYDVYRIYNRRKELILEEVAKCDLVCANCHRIRTAARGYPR